MGADLLLAHCVAPIYDGRSVQDYEEIREAVNMRLAAIPSGIILEFYPDMEVDEHDNVTSECIRVLADEVGFFVTSMYSDREIVVYESGAIFQRAVCFTGGMSWGDNPSDWYQIVWFIHETGLFEHPFYSIRQPSMRYGVEDA